MEMRSHEITEVVEKDEGVEITVDDLVTFTVSEAPDGKPMVRCHDLSKGETSHETAAANYWQENY